MIAKPVTRLFKMTAFTSNTGFGIQNDRMGYCPVAHTGYNRWSPWFTV